MNTHYQLPGIFFRLIKNNIRYDISPVTVKATLYKENIYHFLVQLCAIIGGIFTVTGIIDSLIHESVSAIIKKASMGKLT
jgi:hypothetical protein